MRTFRLLSSKKPVRKIWRAKICASNIAISTCAAQSCSTTSMMRAKAVAKIREYMDSQRLYRDRNADPAQIHARRRARFYRAVAHSREQVFRAAAIAADSETAHDDRRFRQDITRSHAVSAMKTCAPTASPNLRSWTWRCRLPTGEGLPRDGRLIQPRVQADRRRSAREVSANDLCGSDAALRLGQARPAF